MTKKCRWLDNKYLRISLKNLRSTKSQTSHHRRNASLPSWLENMAIFCWACQKQAENMEVWCYQDLFLSLLFINLDAVLITSWELKQGEFFRTRPLLFIASLFAFVKCLPKCQKIWLRICIAVWHHIQTGQNMFSSRRLEHVAGNQPTVFVLISNTSTKSNTNAVTVKSQSVDKNLCQGGLITALIQFKTPIGT